MSVGDMVAIASFLLTLVGIVFYLGKIANRFERMERDINGLGSKVDAQNYECEARFAQLDQRLDRFSEFVVRNDQRVAHLEERVYGEDTMARVRQLDT